MTRRDQIVDQALRIEKQMNDEGMCINWGLIEMAEWVDVNPDELQLEFKANDRKVMDNLIKCIGDLKDELQEAKDTIETFRRATQ